MAVVRLSTGMDVALVPASASTRVGRHWSNDLRLSDPAAPLHWLELRWRGDHWAWRTLSARSRTRGTGKLEDEEWRSWAGGRGVARLDGAATSIEFALVDGSPPAPFIEDFATGARLSSESSQRILEIWKDGRAWPLGSEPDQQRSMRDGEVFVHHGVPHRYHGGCALASTQPNEFDCSGSDVTLDIDLGTRSAVWGWSPGEVRISGACVVVLATYALARLEAAESEAGGWLDTESARARWIALGGNSESPMARLGWERGKLRSRLSAAGAAGLERLFEWQRSEGVTRVRLVLSAHQLRVHGLADQGTR